MSLLKIGASILFVLSTSSVSFATSLYNGPYLYKTVGKNTCLVWPGTVRITRGGRETVRDLNLNSEELAKAIRQAAKGKLQTLALHMKATVPAVEISAGVGYMTGKVLLYRDASKIEGRTDRDSKDLIKQVQALCGNL